MIIINLPQTIFIYLHQDFPDYKYETSNNSFYLW